MTTLRAAALPALAALGAGGAVALLGAPGAAVLLAAVAGAAAGGAAAGRRRASGAPARPAAARAGPAIGDPAAETRALLDALPVGVLVVGRDGTIRLANRGAAESFGLPALPPAGARLPVAMLRAPRLLAAIEAARAGDAPAGAVEFTRPGRGEATLGAHLRPLADGSLVVAIEDRTAARLSGDVHRDFVANASHELKTPLAAVSGIIETLLGHARDDPAATERFLGLMAGQVRRMARLVEDLLSLNRIELNERVAPRDLQDMAGIVAEALEALAQAADAAGARIEVTAPAGLPQVRGDRNELGQLVRNLVENATRYGGPGTVRVSITAPPAQAEAAAGAPAMLALAVSDDGPGIAREHLPRLTERFYRVSAARSREAGGTGLGLAIVKHIVARHRGRLEIASAPGEGACFTVWLPVAETTGATAGR